MKFKQYLINEMSIAHAFTFAANLHQGQFRKGSGAPYITHPRATYKILKSLSVNDRDVLIATILHDTIEDTPTTYNLIKKEFNKEVADLVKAVTSIDKELKIMGKPEYLANKMIKMSDKALLIKLADRYHNVSDMNFTSQKFMDKTTNQTYYILQRLKEERKLTNNHKKLIRMILKKIGKL